MTRQMQLGGEVVKVAELGEQAGALITASKREVKTVVVADGGTKSGALDCGEVGMLVGYSFPSGLDGTTYQALENEDGAIALTIAASKSYGLDNPSRFLGWRYVKFVVGEQTDALTITAIVMAV